MKRKIIEIIGFSLEPELAEIKANEIVALFRNRDCEIINELSDKFNKNENDSRLIAELIDKTIQ